MTKLNALAWIQRTKVVPVIRAKSPEQALSVIEVLIKGGVDVLEITMTVPGAVELIREVEKQYSDKALIGAGTVYDVATAESCIGAGAKFIVGPCLDVPTVKACNSLNTLVAPGALTPTEVIAAHRAGADVIKIFPCDSAGGPTYIKSLKTPFPHLQLMPTGGVSLVNAQEFLKAGAIAVGVGNSLVDPKLIDEGNWEALQERARSFIDATRD